MDIQIYMDILIYIMYVHVCICTQIYMDIHIYRCMHTYILFYGFFISQS